MYILILYILDESRMVCWDSAQLERLTFVEELVFLAKDIRQLYSRDIPMVKVRWRHYPIEKTTWEFESNIHSS